MDVKLHAPRSTYRLQFNKQFTLSSGSDLSGYLAALGISHCYASPLYTSRPESTHGYDVCDAQRINPCLGGLEGFAHLSHTLHCQGLGLVLDVVPNHMAADPRNVWWADVLENGPDSAYAGYFDIDWCPAAGQVRSQLLLPLLEDRYGRVLEDGKLRLAQENQSLSIAYHDQRFPVSTRSLRFLASKLKDGDLGRCQPATHGSLQNRAQLLDSLLTDSGFPGLLKRCNGQANNPSSFELLDEFLKLQYYQLAYWRLASTAINYRRFFEISGLVSVRVEDPAVFEATHRLTLQLIREGHVAGLRIDHPDGLRDPELYFTRLRAGAGSALYIVAEKILGKNESLPGEWDISGTTGYDFLNLANGLFIAPAGYGELERVYDEFCGAAPPHSEDLGRVCKRMVLKNSFGSELDALAARLQRVASETREGRDLFSSELREAIIQLVSTFPVYRTYISGRTATVSGKDEEYIREACARADRVWGSHGQDARGFVARVLLLQTSGLPPEIQFEAREFIYRFQQLCAPAMAKGIEDTAFYRRNVLICVQEVGGDPAGPSTSVQEFHEGNLERLRKWPDAMLATATHDTKRGEDSRARLCVFSEMPGEWREAALQWRSLNAKAKVTFLEGKAPDLEDEYLFYQAVVGAWPGTLDAGVERERFAERLCQYMLKAIREAKRNTSWIDPNAAYETATLNFVRSTLNSPEFLNALSSFLVRAAHFGRINSLSQTLLKLTSPGIPDLYQGTELWDLSLVDPDNRICPDFDLRKRMLQRMINETSGYANPQWKQFTREVLAETRHGTAKLFVIWKTLQFRNQNPILFLKGEYIPLAVTGPACDHVCAFARYSPIQGLASITVTPRFVCQLTGGRTLEAAGAPFWQDTLLELPPSLSRFHWENVFTRQHLNDFSLSSILSDFPVALLQSSGG